MRKLFSRTNVALGGVVLGVMAFAGNALAAAGDPPSFDADTLGPTINDYATALLTGVVILLGVVLVAIVPFTLVRLGIKYIKKWFGAGKATSTA